ncbi:MAG: ABC transporter permease [Bacteroidota bacterium]
MTKGLSKILIIIRREFLTRIRRRSFIIMSILGPMLFAGILILPTWLMSVESKEVKRIAVIDSTHIFQQTIPETKYLKFDYLEGVKLKEIKKNFDKTNYYAVLYITHIVHYSPQSIQLYSDKQPSMSVVMHISNAIEKKIERQKLASHNIENINNILRSVKTDINIQTIRWTDAGEEKESHPALVAGVSYFSGFLIYIFIFMFGAQVMRSVIEEKTSRIVEIIISSVRPFQLMMGKIIGVALAGLTQFILWIFLTIFIFSSIQNALIPDVQSINNTRQPPVSVLSNQKPDNAGQEQTYTSSSSALPEEYSVQNPFVAEFRNILNSARAINFTVMISMFLFYFLGGYLLYSSLFAAVGSLIDNETDTQQFMLPVTIPLVAAIIVMLNAFQNPESSITFWFSVIPFTSPIIMMARIPYGVPYPELILSMSLLVLTFIFTTWISGRIYRTAILVYGKKIRFNDVLRWLKHNTK